MTLQDKIDALPEWPTWEKDGGFDWMMSNAALARLELCREWIEGAPHQPGCYAAHYRATAETQCICGRDALLKAMEVPRD
jgi:hypothetical protein